jgi:NAD(P)-dependent dehydrogenase (short-subunit alcohol dehydrogenase family)
MAREGADVSIVYLPSEQPDAQTTEKSVEQENQSCLLIQGDLRDRSSCRRAVDEHVKKSAYSIVPVLGND